MVGVRVNVNVLNEVEILHGCVGTRRRAGERERSEKGRDLRGRSEIRNNDGREGIYIYDSIKKVKYRFGEEGETSSMIYKQKYIQTTNTTKNEDQNTTQKKEIRHTKKLYVR